MNKAFGLFDFLLHKCCYHDKMILGDNMKLAVALQERADLNKKIEQLNYRLGNNAVVQDGEKTQETPEELLNELNTCLDNLEKLICRINLTNCQTKTNYKDMTLTELIARKDILTVKINSYRNLVNTASNLIPRVSRSEIKIKSNIDIKATQKEIDKLSKELRLVDNSIQEINWTVDLL